MSACEVLVPTSRAEGEYASSDRIKTLIVHRDFNVAENLRAALGEIPEYEVVADCVSGVEAAEAVLRHQPTILLLDVHVPRIEMLRGLLQDRRCPLVIYLVGAESPIFSQLTKSERELVFPDFETPKITEIAQRVKRQLSRGGRKRSRNLLSFFLGEPAVRQNERFAFKCGKKLVVLDMNEIVSIEADSGYSRVHTLTESYGVRYSLAELSSGLDVKTFYRISTSAVINVNAIRELSCGWGADKFVILKDGRTMQVTKPFASELKKSSTPLGA